MAYRDLAIQGLPSLRSKPKKKTMGLLMQAEEGDIHAFAQALDTDPEVIRGELRRTNYKGGRTEAIARHKEHSLIKTKGIHNIKNAKGKKEPAIIYNRKNEDIWDPAIEGFRTVPLDQKEWQHQFLTKGETNNFKKHLQRFSANRKFPVTSASSSSSTSNSLPNPFMRDRPAPSRMPSLKPKGGISKKRKGGPGVGRGGAKRVKKEMSKAEGKEEL